MERYEAKKARKSAKHHLKGPAKRKKEDNEKFYHLLVCFLERKCSSMKDKKQNINRNEEPHFNETTREALAEMDEMKKHPEKYKVYDTFDELMEDIHKED